MQYFNPEYASCNALKKCRSFSSLNFDTIRGTGDFLVAASASQQPFRSPRWNTVLEGTLPGVPAVRDRCSAVNSTFSVVGSGSSYRYVKFVAKTYIASGAGLEYMGIFE